MEWFPGAKAALFGVNPGDDIYVYVQSNSATSVSYTIVDHTIPQVATGTISAPAGVKSPSGVDPFAPKPCVNVGNDLDVFRGAEDYLAQQRLGHQPNGR